VCLNYCYHIYQNLLNFTYAFKCYYQKMQVGLTLAGPPCTVALCQMVSKPRLHKNIERQTVKNCYQDVDVSIPRLDSTVNIAGQYHHRYHHQMCVYWWAPKEFAAKTRFLFIRKCSFHQKISSKIPDVPIGNMRTHCDIFT